MQGLEKKITHDFEEMLIKLFSKIRCHK